MGVATGEMSLTSTEERSTFVVEFAAWSDEPGEGSTMSKCEVFKPFPLATEVCDTCGGEAGDHPERRADMLPYKEAIWAYMLEHGGPYSYYGGYESWKAQEIKKHIKECGLNFKKMSTPTMDEESEFNGTFDESTSIEVLKGYIVCNCDEYEYSKWPYHMQNWCLRDKTLGQVIWHVVKAGEIKE